MPREAIMKSLNVEEDLINLKYREFKQELTRLINKYSMENLTSMPDFLMAEYIVNLLKATGDSLRETVVWHKM